MYERNAPCPCGSGKKYKKCCISKITNPLDVWKQRALRLSLEFPNNETLVDTFFTVLDHAMRKNWRGACHTVSSILYILLREQRIQPNLEIGFVASSKIPFPFCHSWITIDGKPYDIGLYRSNPTFQRDDNSYIEVSAPIFKGIDIENQIETNISFGVLSDRESVDRNFQTLVQRPLGDYMDAWPNHKDGLWGEAIEIAARMGLTLNKHELKAKYYEDRFHKFVATSLKSPAQ